MSSGDINAAAETLDIADMRKRAEWALDTRLAWRSQVTRRAKAELARWVIALVAEVERLQADNDSLRLANEAVKHNARHDNAELIEQRERLRAERDALEKRLERAEDRAVCSGCGSDVPESGICDYPGCDDGQTIPSSELPLALRDACDAQTELWQEYRADEVIWRDREQRLMEALRKIADANGPDVELWTTRDSKPSTALMSCSAYARAALAATGPEEA